MRVWVSILTVAALAITYAYIMWARSALAQREEWKEFYAGLDGFWASLWARIRHGWLMITAVVLAVGPELPGLLTEFGMLDLSFLLPPEVAFKVSKLIALAALIARVWLGAPKPPVTPEAKP